MNDVSSKFLGRHESANHRMPTFIVRPHPARTEGSSEGILGKSPQKNLNLTNPAISGNKNSKGKGVMSHRFWGDSNQRRDNWRKQTAGNKGSSSKVIDSELPN